MVYSAKGGGVFPLLGWALLSGPDERRTGVSLATRWIVVPKATPTQPADSSMRLLRATMSAQTPNPASFDRDACPATFDAMRGYPAWWHLGARSFMYRIEPINPRFLKETSILCMEVQ